MVDVCLWLNGRKQKPDPLCYKYSLNLKGCAHVCQAEVDGGCNVRHVASTGQTVYVCDYRQRVRENQMKEGCWYGWHVDSSKTYIFDSCRSGTAECLSKEVTLQPPNIHSLCQQLLIHHSSVDTPERGSHDKHESTPHSFPEVTLATLSSPSLTGTFHFNLHSD